MKTYHIAIPLLSNDVTLSWPSNYLRLLWWRDIQGVFPFLLRVEAPYAKVYTSISESEHAKSTSYTVRR